MGVKLMRLLFLAGAVGLVCVPAVSAAPRPKDKTPTEKELKAFAAKVAATLIKKDIDGFLSMCEVPFHQPGGYFSKDKKDLRRWITKALGNGRYRNEVREVKRVETFKKAKARFSASEVGWISRVLSDGDFVVDVEMELLGQRKEENSLLITVKSGKPRLVGWEVRR